ncbi:MAG: 50S ribosomal protein L11 methyltransferase, partial [Clostridia bacterium]|nr:50S ribosomal protein L11 methyltransferase [Clostridia bacterium]
LAAKTAVENGKVNAFTPPAFSVFCGDMTEQIRDKFDVVTANIVADVLIIFLKTARQFMKPNGIFIISGIIDTREEDILNSIKENNFTIKERHESKEWRCFVLT